MGFPVNISRARYHQIGQNSWQFIMKWAGFSIVENERRSGSERAWAVRHLEVILSSIYSGHYRLYQALGETAMGHITNIAKPDVFEYHRAYHTITSCRPSFLCCRPVTSQPPLPRQAQHRQQYSGRPCQVRFLEHTACCLRHDARVAQRCSRSWG